MSEIEVPSFDFASFYYPDFIEALITYKRANLSEHTDETAQDPLIQMIRMIALVGHINHSTLDMVANESTLPTAQLPETVRNMLRLIGYELASDTPGQADLVLELAQVLTTATEVVPDGAQFATKADATTTARFFEALVGHVVARTDQLTRCLAVEDGVAINRTTEANAVTGTFVPWATPVGGSSSREGDSLMICHADVMYDQIDVDLTVAGVGIVGVWEYYDGIYSKAQPDAVVDQGTTLRLTLTAYLGATDRRGTPIRIALNETGAHEDVFSAFVSGVNVADTTGLLGQVTPSTVTTDYTVGSAWERIPELTDGTSNLIQDGSVDYDLPQSLLRNWSLGTLFGVEGFWFRFRIISVSTPTSPTIDRIQIDQGKQFLKQAVHQGQEQEDNPLGSSDGSASQSFQGLQDHYIDGTAHVFVDEVEWPVVDNFLASQPTDRHVVVSRTTNDRPVFKFGDGVAGARPAAGVGNIRVTYRYGANEDGNVGANTITADKSGLTFVSKVNNPRPASGWEAAEGSTAESLERAKIAGPASLRTRDVAISPSEAEDLALRASKIDSSVIAVSRAKAIEEAFGPKTVELVVVAAGGQPASSTQLSDLSVFFNGDQFSSPVKKKRIVANQEVTATNYAPRVISVTVNVETSGETTSAQVIAALTRLLQPEAKKSDGINFEWSFGGRVALSRLANEVFKLDEERITDVDIPGSDIVLLARELPVAGTITVNITQV